MSPTPSSASDLVEIEQIKRLKYKYLRCLDQKLWDEIAECFTPDATAAYSGGKYAFDDAQAIIAFLRQAMGADSFHSSHRVHHPEIELTIRGAAFYEDEYLKVDGEWKIQHTGYRRTYEEMQPRKEVPGLKLTASWWASDGRSELDA
jgi:hypothetical protein